MIEPMSVIVLNLDLSAAFRLGAIAIMTAWKTYMYICAPDRGERGQGKVAWSNLPF